MYQPEWLHGEVVAAGERVCDDRWRLIRWVLDRYRRPFTVLDLGANLGYFSLRAAETYEDCTAVAVDHDPDLRRVLTVNDHPRVIGLDQSISLDWLRALAEVEHFDVIFALSVLHHLDAPFDETLNVLRSLGDLVVVEPATEPVACGQHIVTDTDIPADALTLGEVGSHLGGIRPVFVVGAEKRTSIRTLPYLGAPKATDVRIRSSLFYKSVDLPRKNETRNWVRGINLLTYLACGGFTPSRSTIADMVGYREGHGDVRPWNYILSGDTVTLIDADDPRHEYRSDDSDGYTRTLRSVMEDHTVDDVISRFTIVLR